MKKGDIQAKWSRCDKSVAMLERSQDDLKWFISVMAAPQWRSFTPIPPDKRSQPRCPKRTFLVWSSSKEEIATIPLHFSSQEPFASSLSTTTWHCQLATVLMILIHIWLDHTLPSQIPPRICLAASGQSSTHANGWRHWSNAIEQNLVCKNALTYVLGYLYKKCFANMVANIVVIYAAAIL